MQVPFFYTERIAADSNELVLDEDNSRHAVSVLRMQRGDTLHITDGLGTLVTASITDPHKKKCGVSIAARQQADAPAARTGIAVSLVKNPVRFEWFLEKATEIGITDIIPLVCSRTEKQHFRYSRLKNVLVSALLQSRQTWLPRLQEPVPFEAVLQQSPFEQKFIAHCLDTDRKPLSGMLTNPASGRLVLIGPEGDFTPAEIAAALQNGCLAVTLGQTRLRTETAALVAAVLLVSSR